MSAQVLPSTTDQLTIAAPLDSDHPKKKHLVLVFKCKQHVSSDQVTTEHFPHRAPWRSLGLVAARLIFWHLFEAFQHLAQAIRTDTSTGADTQPAKRLRAPPMRRTLVPKYVTVLTCALLFVNLSYILMIHLSIGNLRLLINRRKLLSPHLLHRLPWSLLLQEWLIPQRCLLLSLGTFIGGQLNSWRAWRTEKLINRVTRLLLYYFFLLISLADLWPSLFVVLTNDLKAAQKALSDEKSVWLGAVNSLAKEKAARQAAEQSIQQSQEANTTLALELENTHTSLAATRDKLDSKSKDLDFQVIRADEAMLRLKNAESRLKVAEEDLKN
jgi:hypothetical protein